MSQHSQFGPRPRIATTRPAVREFGDIRDELGKVEGCHCEPAVRGHYSGTIMPTCPAHRAAYEAALRPPAPRKPWFSIPIPKERWEYQGAGPWDGRRCYFFRREDIGTGGTTRIIPVDEYWASVRQ